MFVNVLWARFNDQEQGDMMAQKLLTEAQVAFARLDVVSTIIVARSSFINNGTLERQPKEDLTPSRAH